MKGTLMEKDIQFKKNFIWNIIGTGFNAFKMFGWTEAKLSLAKVFI